MAAARTLARAAAVVFALAGPLAAELPVSRIADLRSMPRERALEAERVRVRGVVTWRKGGTNLTIQDKTAGIWVDFVEARNRGVWTGRRDVPRQLRVGAEVELEGVMHPGGYAPQIVPARVRVLSASHPLPDPLPLDRARFFSGADDCQRVEILGVVQSVHATDDGVTLLMDANPGRFTVQIGGAKRGQVEHLVDAEVRVRGVAGTQFNTRGEATGVRVMAGSADALKVERPPPSPAEVPTVALDRLLPFRADPIGPHRVRVEGTVTFALPGSFIYLQEGDCAVRVETSADGNLRPGDRVEATGFVEMSRLIGTLCDAALRKTGESVVPEPVEINPLAILALNAEAVRTAQVAKPHDFDGHLIRCRARLLAVQSEPHGDPVCTLTLEEKERGGQGTLVFRAVHYGGGARALEALAPGSELELVGLVRLDYVGSDPAPRLSRIVPSSLSLILRGPSDVTVVSTPSWWTARHFAGVLAAVLLALGGALVWSLQLKRQIRRKTRLLAREMAARRDAAVEFEATLRERTRLAANLHDTLLQTMSGIGFQIEACEAGASKTDDGGTQGHLKVAKRMVSHAVDELRNSVWALRSLPLHGMELSEAIQTLARRLGAGREARIEVRAEGDLTKVPDFIAGNILLVVQEALHNALTHGAPRVVRVDIQALDEPARVELTVTDDGSGFVPGEQLGAAQGHFGLQGMRERIERLDGGITIHSAPGRGTKVHAVAPLRPYDDALADPS